MLRGNPLPLAKRKWEIELSLSEIALASIEADSKLSDFVASQESLGVDFEKVLAENIEELYVPSKSTPPAPVSVPDEQRAMLWDMDDEIFAELEEEEKTCRDEIRKCIAALRYHHKRAEAHSTGYKGSTLEEDTLKSINFLRRTSIAAILQGAEPVSNRDELPDGWVACSERMPEDEQEVITHNIFGYRHVSFFDEHSGNFFNRLDGSPVDCVEHVLVSHWMPMPAAPQQEVK
ncbi:DUF551 domain-containing protein [Enterobacter hormaechei subsp. xiangfangensis]|nr:DUF551 domain-containing protein [Enterobacter hormaechei subsp. xiangfangensis]